MVNIECQSSSFLFDDPSSRYLRKMSSSSNLYDYLNNTISFQMLLNPTDDHDDDDDLSIPTSPTTMTNSDSSDSAIVSDEIDDSNHRYSRSKTLEKSDTSLLKSFNILTQPTIYENSSPVNQVKYKRPLPWLNSSALNSPRSRPLLQSSSSKVL